MFDDELARIVNWQEANQFSITDLDEYLIDLWQPGENDVPVVNLFDADRAS